MGKCGGGTRAKEIAYANLQTLYSKLWHSASIQYTLNMNNVIIYLFLTKARVMSDSVNCNFARCAVRHFISAHLTKNHVLPRALVPPHSLYDYRHREACAALESPPHSLYVYRHRPACAALESPLTPCTTTGTEKPVLHSIPPLTPCTTTGTEKPVLHSSPPLTPCTTTGTEKPVLHSIPPPHSLYDYRHREACAALDSPPPLTPCMTTGTEKPVQQSKRNN